MKKLNRRFTRLIDRAFRMQRGDKRTATANRAEVVLARYYGRIPVR